MAMAMPVRLETAANASVEAISCFYRMLLTCLQIVQTHGAQTNALLDVGVLLLNPHDISPQINLNNVT